MVPEAKAPDMLEEVRKLEERVCHKHAQHHNCRDAHHSGCKISRVEGNKEEGEDIRVTYLRHTQLFKESCSAQGSQRKFVSEKVLIDCMWHNDIYYTKTPLLLS